MTTTKKETIKKNTITKKSTNKGKIIKEKKIKKENKVINALKKFFNHPAPLIIVLLIIVIVLTMYIANYNSKNKIYVGYLDKEDMAVANVHLFLNGDMNYFHATNATYLGKDKDIYAFQVGYYAVDDNDNYYALATRGNSLDDKTSLKDVVEENSGWSFAESDKGILHFSNDVRNNINNIHFVVKAATKKDTLDPDIIIDYPLNLEKITK